jgi:hypothetical protein
MSDTEPPTRFGPTAVPDGNPQPGAPAPPPYNPHHELIGNMERPEFPRARRDRCWQRLLPWHRGEPGEAG